MSRMVRIVCPQVTCGAVNEFLEDELESGLAIVDEDGNVVNAHPKVEIDANTFVECDQCRYPISCAHAVISNKNNCP